MAYELENRAMEYELESGEKVRLTMNMIKRFLVSGRPELVTEQEMLHFMHVCKAQRMNPFLKECYIIKYTNDPAAVITSINHLRKLAMKAPDCQGWQAGIIVQDENKMIRNSYGLLLSGETLCGGWFEAQPKGWAQPYKLEVPLAPYVKRKRDGSVTSFWRQDNQAVMIRKVAESQGLRFLWGGRMAGMLSHEEASAMQGDRDEAPEAITKPSIDTARRDMGLYQQQQATMKPVYGQAKTTAPKNDQGEKQEPDPEPAPEPEPEPEPDPDPDFDPIHEKPLGRYTKEKAQSVRVAADQLGIQYKKSWPPSRIHNKIHEELEKRKHGPEANQVKDPEPEPDDKYAGTHGENLAKGTARKEKADLEKFWQLVDERLNEEEKYYVNEFIQDLATKGNLTPEGIIAKALLDKDRFFLAFEAFANAKLENNDKKTNEREELIDRTENCLSINRPRWEAIVKKGIRNGYLPDGNYNDWKTEQLKQVCEEFYTIENDHLRQKGQLFDEDKF